MPSEPTCPPDEAFVAFISGDGDAAERARIEAHIDRCPICADLLAQLARSPLVHVASDAETPDLDEAPAIPRRLIPGESVGRYVIESEHGSGGMGIVYRARDPKLDRRVAVKLLRPRHSDGQARLLAEAQTLAAVSHPNVIEVFDVGQVGAQVYVAMELVRGANLREWQASAAPGWADALGVCVAVGRGVEAVHAGGIIHRDIKPSNVLIAEDGRVLLIDFGLAGQLARASSRDVVGTPGYIAPEQLEGAMPGPAGDQYAFCVLVHEVLYGARPFDETGVANEVDRSGMPSGLWTTLQRGLSQRPGDRFETMGALLAALERAAAPPRLRALWLVGGLAAGALVIGFAVRSEPRCDAGPERVAQMWAGHREQAASAFATTELSFATATWSRVERDVDAWAERWVVAYGETCERAGADLDASMSCLERARRRVAAIVRALAEADHDTIVEASRIGRSLPGLDGCREPGPAPPEPAAEAVYDRVAAAEVEFARGRFEDALVIAADAQRSAAALDDARLLAAAELTYGRVAAKKGDFDLAESHLQAAATAAEAAADDTTAVRARTELVWLEGYQRLRFDAARAHARHAGAALERIGDDPQLRAGLEYRLAWIDLKAGDPAAAQVHLRAALSGHTDPMERAADYSALGAAHLQLSELDAAQENLARGRELGENALGPNHPDLIPVLSNIGAAQRFLGQLSEAEATYLHLIAVAQEAFGPEHAMVGRLQLNLGVVYADRGQFAASLEVLQAAEVVLEATVGPDHPEFARALDGQAEALHHEGELDAAISRYERALAIKVAALGADHPNVAVSLTNLGMSRVRAGRAEQALPVLARAAELIEAAHGETEQLVTVFGGWGEALAELGRDGEAAAKYDRAIALGERFGSADLGTSLRWRAELHLRAGAPALALPLLRRAVARWREQDGEDPVFEGYALYALARTLWALGEHDEARASATEALQRFAGRDPDNHAEASAWLRGR